MQVASAVTGPHWVNAEFASEPPPPAPVDHGAPARATPPAPGLDSLPLPPHIARQIAPPGQPITARDTDGWEPVGTRGTTAGLPEREFFPERMPGSVIRDNRMPPPRFEGGASGRDIPTLGAPTPIAAAAAEVAASVPAAPTADPMELAALELLLAEPANREMVEHFGGQLEPLPTWTSVGQGIEARYGADLGGRLYQLQQAQRAVEGEFFQALDQARQNPPAPPAPIAPRRGEAAPTSELPGWVYSPGGGHADDWRPPSWRFDPGAFASAYAAGDSPAQRAFAYLHGGAPLQYVPAPDTETAGPDHWAIAGQPISLGRYLDRDEGLTSYSVRAGRDAWAPSIIERPEHHLDPDRITKLHNKELVWFDPERGFVTDRKNLKGGWLDRAFPQVMGAAFGVIGAWAVSGVVAGAGAVAQGAAAGAVGSTLNQYVSTGHVSFKSVLQSALAGGLTAGVASLPGVGQHIDGLAGSFGQRLMEYTGRATLQGAIQSVVGGRFKDGFVNSLMASVAGEVSGLLNAEIAELSQSGSLNESQASTMRLLARATGSALRIVGSDDPAAGFAADFLSGVMGEALGAEADRVAQAADDPLGEFIAENEQAWAERQANYDQIAAAFGDTLPIDRTDDTLLAAGPGFVSDGPSIKPSQSALDDIAGIATSDLSWADKLRMTRDTIAYHYRNSAEFQGWVQMAGGTAEALSGLGLSAVPGGMLPGSLAIVHGADNFVAGLRRQAGEGRVNTVTYDLINAATDSPWLADAVDRGIPFVTGVAGGAAAINAASISVSTTNTLARYGNSGPKLIHIFDEAEHNLGQLTRRYGSNEAAFAAVDHAAQRLAGRPGVVTQWIDVGGTPVWVRGITVNGSFRIGTFSGNTLNSKYPLP